MARKCVLCGKEYEYCPSCPKDKSKALWNRLYDNENCRNIFEALNNYNFKLATKEETKAILSKCDLSIELNDHYRGEINDIMGLANKDESKTVVEEEVKSISRPKTKSQPKEEVEEK